MLRAHAYVCCWVIVVACAGPRTETTTPSVHAPISGSQGIIGLEPTSTPDAHVLEGWVEVRDIPDLARHIDQAAEKGTPVIVHITATWCVDCLALQKNVLGHEKVAKRLADVRRVLVDVTSVSDQSEQLLGVFGVEGLPAILFYDDVVPLAGFLMAPQKAPRPAPTTTILETVDADELLRRLQKTP